MSLADYIRRYKWDLAIAVAEEGHRYDLPDWKLHVIKAPKDRWFADPFILDVTDGHIYVLVEELEHATDKGRLAKLTVDRSTYEVMDVKIILELPEHLSFPAIYRDGNDVYIYPENSASGKSVIYMYYAQNDTLTPVAVLADKPLTDAVMLDYEGGHYVFSTMIPSQNGNTVSVYKSEDKISCYEEAGRIVLDDNSARSAGDFFEDSGKIIRPAQDCNGAYGSGLVFQELTCDGNGSFVLKELFRRSAPKGYIGMHTYNTYKGYTVVDLHARRHPVLHRIFQRLKHIFK